MAVSEALARLIRMLERKTFRVTEFWTAVYDLSRNEGITPLREHLPEALTTLVILCEREVISSYELWQSVRNYVELCPRDTAHVLATLSGSAHASVRALEPWFSASFLADARSRDFDYLRHTSPLQPGTRIALFGGYTAAYSSPWWLEGRQRRLATFIGFAAARMGSEPLAFVELDEEVNLGEASGKRHAGKFAVLSVGRWYSPGALPAVSWTSPEHETLAVHVVEELPSNIGAISAYYAVLPATETHSSYATLGEPAMAAPHSLWPLGKEIGAALDAFHQAPEGDLAAGWLRNLLQRAPQLWLTVAPSLLPLLANGGATDDALAKLFRERGINGLKVLAAHLEAEDSAMRGTAATVIGHFGAEARCVVPLLEPLLLAEPSVRVPAALALWKSEGRTANLGPLVLEGLMLDAFSAECASCIRAIGPDLGDLAPALGEILAHHSNPNARTNAALALGGLGYAAMPAVEQLIAALDEAHESVRLSAFAALREIRSLAEFAEMVLERHACEHFRAPLGAD